MTEDILWAEFCRITHHSSFLTATFQEIMSISISKQKTKTKLCPKQTPSSTSVLLLRGTPRSWRQLCNFGTLLLQKTMRGRSLRPWVGGGGGTLLESGLNLFTSVKDALWITVNHQPPRQATLGCTPDSQQSGLGSDPRVFRGEQKCEGRGRSCPRVFLSVVWEVAASASPQWFLTQPRVSWTGRTSGNSRNPPLQSLETFGG